MCMSNPANVAIIPCGHLCVCKTCAAMPVLKACPICRGVMSGTLRVFGCSQTPVTETPVMVPSTRYFLDFTVSRGDDDAASVNGHRFGKGYHRCEIDPDERLTIEACGVAHVTIQQLVRFDTETCTMETCRGRFLTRETAFRNLSCRIPLGFGDWVGK